MNEKCKTKYPLLMVHGTGFRDRKHLQYWGRIPKVLEHEGAVIFYGHQDSWGSVEQNALTIKRTIEKIIRENNCEKLNVIAHSKGGLEMRQLISSMEMSDYIASLTMISVPNHGSKTMSALWTLPKPLFKVAAWFVNVLNRLMGDTKPDFYLACSQMTQEYMEEFNANNPDAENVYYQSYATVMKSALSDVFMSLPYLFVKIFEGDNDGIVSPASAQWTNFRGIWRGTTKRGISHADGVDMRRRHFTKKKKADSISDIRDAYISIVSELKDMGF